MTRPRFPRPSPGHSWPRMSRGSSASGSSTAPTPRVTTSDWTSWRPNWASASPRSAKRCSSCGPRDCWSSCRGAASSCCRSPIGTSPTSRTCRPMSAVSWPRGPRSTSPTTSCGNCGDPRRPGRRLRRRRRRPRGAAQPRVPPRHQRRGGFAEAGAADVADHPVRTGVGVSDHRGLAGEVDQTPSPTAGRVEEARRRPGPHRRCRDTSCRRRDSR